MNSQNKFTITYMTGIRDDISLIDAHIHRSSRLLLAFVRFFFRPFLLNS